MAKLTAIIVVAIVTVFFFGANGEQNSRDKRDFYEVVTNVNVLDWLCKNNPWGLRFAGCSTTTVSPQTTTTTMATKSTSKTGTDSSSTSASSSSTTASIGTTSAPSVLESAHWCKFTNGSYLTLGQTFMTMSCILCQCALNRNIVCNTLTCMKTLCIDNSTPSVKPGDCCATCAYETQGSKCIQNGISFPQGAIVKSSDNTSQCWCQSGTIECRRTMLVTITTTWGESFTNNTTAYVVGIIVCLIIMLGALFCCGCGLLYYYYYHNQQQAMQQAYEQYYNNAGWQPMGEEGQFGDVDAKEREATEGERNQFEYAAGHMPEFIPPPYAVYTGPYGNEEHGKDQKHV